MAHPWQLAILLLGSYLLGSIPFGLIIARLRGVDIRRLGSGNAGATNVGRVMGRPWGLLVLLLDAGKGATAVLVAGWWLNRPNQDAVILSIAGRDLIWLGAGALCVLGNILPVFSAFRGGKGVATSLGVVLGIHPFLTYPGLAAIVLWAVVVRLSGYVSLGSIVAAASLPIGFVVASALTGWPLSQHYPLLALTIALSGTVLIRHRSNIARLLAGTENRARGRGPETSP